MPPSDLLIVSRSCSDGIARSSAGSEVAIRHGTHGGWHCATVASVVEWVLGRRVPLVVSMAVSEDVHVFHS